MPFELSTDTPTGRRWPPNCRELVATLTEGSIEAQRVAKAPHWKRAAGFRPAELSRRFGRLMKALGEPGTVGRAFSASRRQDASDPYSHRLETTPSERASGMDRVVRLKVSNPQTAEQLAGRIMRSGIAESVHPVEARMFGVDDPSALGGLLAMRPGGWAHRLIRADEALALEPGSPDVVVAVLDSGVETTHPEFRGRQSKGYDFVDLPGDDPALRGDTAARDTDPNDDTGHGTHVAGVIGARGLKMLAGVGGKCRVMPVRVLGTRLEGGRRVGIGIIPDIDDGIKFAVDNGADVINLSLGVLGGGGGMPHRRAVRYARMHDVVVVAASGNHGGSDPLFPAAVPGVITVGAVTELQRVAGFSAWGGHVDVVAPGTSIYSADLGGRYRYRDGTSHAAPFVAAVAALLVARAQRSGLAMRERTIRRVIRDTADSSDVRRMNVKAGTGIVNARDAVLLVSHLIRSHLREKGRAESASFGVREGIGGLQGAA